MPWSSWLVFTYKATINALGWLYDPGVVVRIGRKYSAAWALAGFAAVPTADALACVEAARRARRPYPHGGRPKAPPAS